jgi:SAM-dependent methyltransferase
VLDIGAGEGQLARPRAEAGAWVVGIDPVAAQVDEAVRRAGGPVYARAAAAGLPLAGKSFDGAVACLVFEHIDELDAAIGEVARVLAPGGRFVIFLNHPLLQTPDSGWIDDQVLDPPEQYWRVGAYLTEAATLEQVESGVFIRFLHRPLGRYVNALVDAGLRVERLVEPAPPPGFLARAPEYADAATIPRLLVIVCRREPW